jgi:hypothetical protein
MHSPVCVHDLNEAPPIAIVAVTRECHDADRRREGEPPRRAIVCFRSIFQAAVGKLPYTGQARRAGLIVFAIAALDNAHCELAGPAHGWPPVVRKRRASGGKVSLRPAKSARRMVLSAQRCP